ncbi:MAG: enoyl-CoA hydratase/isomerase family protein [Chloroflexi bacterium]|nr:enoyl-CoA hydratase/isomerase family protein [Chloroflexota bacterium]
MAYQFIDAAVEGGVLIVTLDDPPTRNAIGDEMAGELNQELERLESEADLRALVLTGRDPAFCSGANVKRMNEANEARGDTSVPEGVTPWDNLQQQWDTMASGESYMDGVRFVPLRLHNLQKPSIAAVNGYAMGLGMGIALSCDIRIASETARFSETFIRRGLIPADGSCWQLPRMIGLSNTFLLQYTGDAIEAREAYRLGMVSKVVPHSELMATTMELATRLANGPTYSMALTKKLIQESLFKNLEESLLLAGPAQNIARSTSDHKEGVRAFVEKRQPVYKGR